MDISTKMSKIKAREAFTNIQTRPDTILIKNKNLQDTETRNIW